MIFYRFFLMAFCLFMASIAYAGGGLDAATNALTEIKVWLFTFVGVAALVYLLYMVLMVLMEKKLWSDVAAALGYCACAGGALVAGAWALGIFK